MIRTINLNATVLDLKIELDIWSLINAGALKSVKPKQVSITGLERNCTKDDVLIRFLQMIEFSLIFDIRFGDPRKFLKINFSRTAY